MGISRHQVCGKGMGLGSLGQHEVAAQNFRRFKVQKVVFKRFYFQSDTSLVHFQISVFK